MKVFTEEEKRHLEYITRINNGNENGFVIANLYDDYFYKYKVRYNFRSQELTFYRNINSLETDDILGVERFIVERTYLIQYLIDNEYIMPVDDEQQDSNEPQYLGEFDTNGLIPIVKKISPEIAKIIDTYSLKRAYISNKLVQLVSNNFLSIEEQMLEEAKKQTDNSQKSLVEAKKQTKNSQKSVCLSIVTTFFAFLTLVASIVTPFYMERCQKKDKQVFNSVKEEDSQQNIDTIQFIEYIEEQPVIDTIKKHVPKYQFK